MSLTFIIDVITVLFIFLLLIGSYHRKAKKEGITINYGFNSEVVTARLASLFKNWSSKPWVESGRYLKEAMAGFSQSQFNTFKVLGTWQKKREKGMASRGYYKLHDIIQQSGRRPEGRVLSLACGAGGWEQVYTPSTTVTSSLCVTYGPSESTQGHKPFTDSSWVGREKVVVQYSDIREVAQRLTPTDFDTLLFDGGEQHTDPSVELSKSEDLFMRGVAPLLSPHYKVVILKILRPDSQPILRVLKDFQQQTSSGRFYLCRLSRNSNMELYFINSKPAYELTSCARHLLSGRALQALHRLEPPAVTYERFELARTTINPSPNFQHLSPLDLQKSISRLGPTVTDSTSNFDHWRSLGVYPFGVSGSSHQTRNEYAHRLLHDLLPNLPGALSWAVTDTTPESFLGVFRKKVDTFPHENSNLREHLAAAYRGLSSYFRGINFRLTKMSDLDLVAQANKQGAPGVFDTWANVGDFLSQPNFKSVIDSQYTKYLTGRVDTGIFMTMGKREKKKSKLPGKLGSRMVAYLNIPDRMLELRMFGNLLRLTKPDVNRAGVGGVGLHDYGERLREIYKDRSVSDDVAGWDTRLGLDILSMELQFINSLCSCSGGCSDCQVRRALYSVYAYPLILIPYPSKKFVRSELLLGRGQRMSGTNPTYSMNTLTNLAVTIIQIYKSLGLPLDSFSGIEAFALSFMKKGSYRGLSTMDWGVLISGDDKVVSMTRDLARQFTMAYDVLNDLGLYRKDIGRSARSRIERGIHEVEFCSHQYRKVSYFDEMTGRTVSRYVPLRDEAEILAKSTLWLGGKAEGLDAQAWLAAQANNLLLNYHPLRTCRMVGLAYKSSVPDNLVLTDRGAHYLPRPWLSNEHTLTIINECLFGRSTLYPVDGFHVHQFRHLGYVEMREQKEFNPNFCCTEQVSWRRRKIYYRTVRLSAELGGDVGYMHVMSCFEPP